MFTKINDFLKNPKIESTLKRISKDFNEIKAFHMEWFIGFIIFNILRYITALILGYSAFTYFHEFISKVINNIYISIILLIIWQVLLMYFMEKLFKFLFHFKLNYVIILFVITSGLFVIDFVASTNGLAGKMAAKADNTEIFVNEYSKKTSSISKMYDDRIQKLLDANEQLQKRNTEFNANSIRMNQDNIKSLKKEKESLLQSSETDHRNKMYENNQKVSETSFKYYNVIILIQVLQIVSNFFISLYKFISDQETKKVMEKYEPRINRWAKSILKNLVETVESAAENISQAVTIKIVEALNEATIEKVVEPDQNEKKYQPKKQIGFGITGLNATTQSSEQLTTLKTTKDQQKNQSKDQQKEKKQEVETKPEIQELYRIGLTEAELNIYQAAREKWGEKLPLEFEKNAGVNELCRSLRTKFGDNGYSNTRVKKVIDIIKHFDNKNKLCK